MLEGEPSWIADTPEAMRGPLKACARGDLPATVAAMHLLIEAHHAGEAEAVLAGVLGRLGHDTGSDEGRRLRAVLDILRDNPGAWSVVKGVLGDVRHDNVALPPDEQVRLWADAFDRAAQASPEGSVALYALGNPDLLKAATAEVVEQMRDWGLLGRERNILDLGCGIGRLSEALAPEVASVVGIDISREMIEAARRRCAAYSNTSFLQSTGRDLSPFENGSFELVLAVDSFPYLVQTGISLVETHVAEAARVLKPSGDLLILNLSYRGDPEQDRADIRRLAGAFGFILRRAGTQPFTLWDGLAFHLAKAPPP
jgi:ubiquinone/menaquinone biosynthesis C-methylase UbiE